MVQNIAVILKIVFMMDKEFTLTQMEILMLGNLKIIYFTEMVLILFQTVTSMLVNLKIIVLMAKV
jgi:hypothetical protein